jgi:hypothetical protein
MKQGRIKHLLDALVSRFDGFPHGLLASGVDLAALLAFRGPSYRFDLLTGVVEPKAPSDPMAAPMLRFLDSLGVWLRAWIARELAAQGELEAAFIEFCVGEPVPVDLSARVTYSNGEFWRDPTGQAHIERINKTEIVPEWGAVPVVPVALKFCIRAGGRAFLKEDRESAYRFWPERLRADG